MQVKEIMSKRVEYIRPQSTVAEAARIMKDQNIGALPIMENEKPLGFITDRDITIRCIAEHMDPEKTSVSDCMTKNIVTVYEDEEVEEASKRMCDFKVRRVMVMDRKKHPVGMLNLNHIALRTHNEDLIKETYEEFYNQGEA